MQINNLQNKRAIRATLTAQPAIAIAADTKAQHLQRQINPTVSIDFDPLFAHDD
jgi:hypothetical protein